MNNNKAWILSVTAAGWALTCKAAFWRVHFFVQEHEVFKKKFSHWNHKAVVSSSKDPSSHFHHFCSAWDMAAHRDGSCQQHPELCTDPWQWGCKSQEEALWSVWAPGWGAGSQRAAAQNPGWVLVGVMTGSACSAGKARGSRNAEALLDGVEGMGQNWITSGLLRVGFWFSFSWVWKEGVAQGQTNGAQWQFHSEHLGCGKLPWIAFQCPSPPLKCCSLDGPRESPEDAQQPPGQRKLQNLPAPSCTVPSLGHRANCFWVAVECVMDTYYGIGLWQVLGWLLNVWCWNGFLNAVFFRSNIGW